MDAPLELHEVQDRSSPFGRREAIVIDDDAILAVVTRLARPDRNGGQVIERAAILAVGADSAAIEAWIVAHDGKPESAIATSRGGGLHGHRMTAPAGPQRAPRRFVLPAGVL